LLIARNPRPRSSHGFTPNDLCRYMLAILANISTSMYVVLIKKSHQDSTIDSLQLLALTSLLSIVPLALLSYLCGEVSRRRVRRTAFDNATRG